MNALIAYANIKKSFAYARKVICIHHKKMLAHGISDIW